MSRHLTEHDYELLSAYLDGEMTGQERTVLETRLQTEPMLRQELATLRQTVQLVNQLTILKSPRDLTLDTRQYASRRTLAFPVVMSAASAIAAVFLLAFGTYFLRLDTLAPGEVANIAAMPTTTNILDESLPTATLEDTLESQPFAATIPDETEAVQAEQAAAMMEESEVAESDDTAADGVDAFQYDQPADETRAAEPSPMTPPMQAPEAAGSGALTRQSQPETPLSDTAATIPPTLELEPTSDLDGTAQATRLDSATLGTVLILGGGLLLAMAAYFALSRRSIRP